MKRLDPIIGVPGNSPELRFVVDQVNRRNQNTNENNSDLTDRVEVLEAVTPDMIVNKMVVAEVNSDFDIAYDNDGEIITI